LPEWEIITRGERAWLYSSEERLKLSRGSEKSGTPEGHTLRVPLGRRVKGGGVVIKNAEQA